MKITLRGKDCEIQSGDYLIDNGAVWQFVAGDRRALYRDRDGRRVTSQVVSKKALKSIDLSKLRKVEHECFNDCFYYYFDEVKDEKID